LAAIIAGFVIAVTGYNLDGSFSQVMEKCLSWMAGLVILLAGRQN